MRLAFHAPMKPPDDPVISGDRETARLILKALAAEGHEVTIASRLRTWQRQPDDAAFAAISRDAHAESDRLKTLWRDGGAPDLWITYHLYHKAPDLIGPQVTAEFGIPYVVIEGCRTSKHATGPWSTGFAAADAALRHADAVAALHAEDAEGLIPVVPPERLHRLAPFIDAARFDAAVARERTGEPPVLVAVAMLRAGDKESSFRVLAEALSHIEDRPWQLMIAGDGPRRDAILGLFPADRIVWRGMVAPEDMAGIYASGDIYVWPAVNEAFGVAILEAQAAGLPVVAGASGGVPDIMRDGETGALAPEGDADALAAAIAAYLDDPDLRRRHGRAGAAHIRARHDLVPARKAIAGLLAAAVRTHRQRSTEAVS